MRGFITVRSMRFWAPMSSARRLGPHDVTQLLLAWGEGDEKALEELIPLVYEELRRLAKSAMRRELPGHSLQTTDLVNEAYLRIVDAKKVQWQNRAHFFAIAARLMRQILVDFARSRGSAKRSQGLRPAALEEALPISPQQSTDLAALDDALKSLARLDARKSQVVEMRFFGGLTVEETAEALKVSEKTVRRDWDLAKVWLMRELSAGGEHGA